MDKKNQNKTKNTLVPLTRFTENGERSHIGKTSGLNEIRRHDQCDTAAVLLSYQANW